MITTVFFDLETGGLLESHPDIQLAAVAVDPTWQEIATFEAKIQFEESLADAEALRMNHYDAEVWKRSALPPFDVVRSFSKFLDAYKVIELVSKKTGAPYSVAPLAGFNAATFDGPRLRRLFGKTFLPAHPIPLCVLQRALWYFHEKCEKPENYRLETLCKYFGIEFPEAHDALADVRATVLLTKRLQEIT